MKKQVLPALILAAASLPALAQSNVVISGRAAGGIENYRLSGGLPAANGTVNQVSNNSSRIIFSGSEDLGNGLKAFFQVDARFAIDTGEGGAFASGNTGVGLQGGFGKVSMGRWDLHYDQGKSLEKQRSLSDQTFSVEGMLSQVNGTNISRVSRSSNVIKYDTPNFSGFNGTVAYSSNPAAEDGAAAANADKDGAYQVAARYAAGPIDAGVSYWRHNVEGVTNNGDQRSIRGWLGYKFGGLNIGLVLDQSKRRPALDASFVKRTAWAIPVSYTFGQHSVHFHYAKAGDLKGDAPNLNTSAKQWMLGYEYAMSKRTSVGVNYVALSNASDALYNPKGVRAGLQTAAGQDARQLYAGIRHDF